MADATPDDVTLASQAFIYGYPLVYNMHEIAKMSAGTGVLPDPVPFNTLGAARTLLGPEAKFVTPNNDTLYLIAPGDLRNGPLVLTVPDTGSRYYVLQFVDAWTNNFAYIGTRATGNGAGAFLLAPPGYSGPGLDGATVIEVPTTVFAMVGRIAVDGDADLPAVHALQDQFSLEPHAPGASGDGPIGVPVPVDGVPDDLMWWEQFRVAVKAFAPGDVDQQFLDVAARFGVLDDESPYGDLDPARAQVLIDGAKKGAETIETLGTTLIKPVDGWTSAMHAFDYNLDYLSVGTIDTPEWKIADRLTAYVTRAVAARLGLWGNHGYEALYNILWTDGNGDPLDGSHRYELVLPSAPPVDAFWSLSMYDSPDYYLVANPIDRYQIGDRTEGLITADDGSITIYLQAEAPGGDKDANWLPAPTGVFRPVFRSYLPKAPLVDGTYAFPPVRRVD